jgi:TonB-dependent receptor
MLKKLLLTANFSFFSTLIFAQTGTIKGNVADGTTGEAIVGANVYCLQEPVIGSIADINGNFEINKVKSGTYTLILSFISYKTDTIKNVTIYPGQTTVVNSKLFEDVVQLTELVISDNRITNTDIAVITELKKADLVATGISAQQISLSQDRDAAQVIKRVPGVTIVNNRFVNVRGLNERYNLVMLNDIIAPSTEVDSRAFAFDLIPSGMIDRMLVYKSGSAELPGEFAGAVIDLHTKNIIEDNSFSVEYTTSARLGTTLKVFNTYEGSPTDWLGFDRSVRPLPASFPTENLSTIDIGSADGKSQLVNASKSLPNNWATKSSNAPVDSRLNINFSKVWRIGNKRLSNITSFNYTNTRQHSDIENYYYDEFVEADQKSNRRYYYSDILDSKSNRVGLISNFVFEINPNNRIEFRNLFNQQGISQTTLRTGIEDLQEAIVNNLALNYLQRGLYSGQLSGDHSIGERFNLNWIAGYSSINSKQPDYRRIRSQKDIRRPEDPFTIIIPPSASTFDAGRFYSSMNEKTFSNALNFTWKLNPGADEEKIAKVSTGYYIAQTYRDFTARWFAYNWSNLDNRPLDVLNSSFTEIFVPENIGFSSESGKPPYFILTEGTNQSDKYTAQNLLLAGYAGITIPFAEHYRLSTGARIEYNRQQLSSFRTSGDPTKIDNPVTSPLPFINLSYDFNDKSLIRFAYSKTVNRPIFRELAPFNFYDFDRNANLLGNPNLKTADIHNIDLKYEYYPSKSEVVSLGAFYKYFINPIENLNVGGSNLIYSYLQGQSAYALGTELEIRKSLSGLSGSKIIDRINLVLNGTLIKSQVDLGIDSLHSDQVRKRALQGQSPYVLNAGIYYNDFTNGLQINISYNVFGKRIFAVGDISNNPTQYEMPRNQLDFTISKEFQKHWEVKLGIQDILNQSYRLMQDSNRDEKITNIDEPIRTFKPGQYLSLGVIYKVR